MTSYGRTEAVMTSLIIVTGRLLPDATQRRTR